jgi:hypothetical protein
MVEDVNIMVGLGIAHVYVNDYVMMVQIDHVVHHINHDQCVSSIFQPMSQYTLEALVINSPSPHFSSCLV